MSPFFEAIRQTVELIMHADSQLLSIIVLSFRVSLSALLIGLLIGLPIAMALAVYSFPGKKVVHLIVDTMMALPPVVVGLIVYLLLSQSSPLGILGLLYTPTAMIIAQALLITPIIIALSLPHIRQKWVYLKDQLHMLGYRPIHCFGILLREAKFGLITVILAAFGRAISEIGAVMIVGGNIENHTRVMTTSIASETQQGNLILALALGIILIFIALLLNSLVHLFKHRFTRQQAL
ncbi:MAG: ABC transporter permease [Cellvibrionaceae bacterium]